MGLTKRELEYFTFVVFFFLCVFFAFVYLFVSRECEVCLFKFIILTSVRIPHRYAVFVFFDVIVIQNGPHESNGAVGENAEHILANAGLVGVQPLGDLLV